MSRIFLSHSSENNFEARVLADWLAEEGWTDVFLDIDPERGIAAGQRWERALHQAADRCEAVVFLLTRAWLSSGWCRKEYELARSLHKKLFAVVAERGLSVADLPPELKDTWQVTDLVAGSDHRLFRARLPSSDEERHVGFSRAGLDRLRAGLKRAGLDARDFSWPPVGMKDPQPYVGLRPLGPDEAGLFFGRDADLVKALDTLRGLAEGAAPRVAVILGASGAGKSSFLRAGLLPRMARDDGHFVCLPAIRPGRDPIQGETGLVAALDASLAGPHTRADIRAALEKGATGLEELLTPLAEAALRRTLVDAETARPPAIVIAVDQAEELFAAGASADGARLLELLAALAKSDAPPTLILFAIRSDAYEALEQAKALEGLNQTALPLPPMPRHAARDVIQGPADRYRMSGRRLNLDPQLTQALLDDLDKGGGRDTLPLLAFTLEHLFREYGKSGALLLEHYEALGGVAGAIEAGVKRAYARADADARIPKDERARDTLLRRGLVPWLAGIDPDTKTPRRYVARAADIPAEAKPLIDLLVEERLLSVGVDDHEVATIEPAHEALLRQWGKLKGWLQEDFALLAALEAVQRAARDWDANARAEAWLSHRGQRLAEATALDGRPDIAAKLGPQDREYLAACRTQEEARRAEVERTRREREQAQARQLADAERIAGANRRVARRTAAGLVVAIVLALVAGAAAYYAKQQAGRADRAVEDAAGAVNTIVFDLFKQRNRSGVPVDVLRALIDPVFLLGKKLIDSGEVSVELRRSYVGALDAAVDTYLSAGDLSAAESAAELGLSESKKLAQDSTDPQAQRDLALSYNKVGDVKLQQGDLVGALQAYEHGLSIRKTLALLKNAEAQRDLSVSLGNVGDVKLRQGDLAGALEAYENSLAICQALAAATTTTEAQRDLEHSLEDVGNVERMQGDFAGASAAYEKGLAIARALAQSGTDAQAQRDLAVCLNYVGDVKLRQNDPAGALQDFEEGFKIFHALAIDASNAVAQRDLATSLDWVGRATQKLGNLDDAFVAFKEAVLAVQPVAANSPSDKQAQDILRVVATDLGGLAYAAIFTKTFRLALDASDLAFSALPEALWLLTNKAHALMFLHRTDEARALYLAHRGAMANNKDTWEAMILADFDAFRKAGLTHPLMDEITAAFASAKPAP